MKFFGRRKKRRDSSPASKGDDRQPRAEALGGEASEVFNQVRALHAIAEMPLRASLPEGGDPKLVLVALDPLEEALAVIEASRKKQGGTAVLAALEGKTLVLIGHVHLKAEQPTQARRAYEQALTVCEDAGLGNDADRVREVLAAVGRGGHERAAEDRMQPRREEPTAPDPAPDRIRQLEQVVSQLREGGDAERLATGLQSLGSECLLRERAEEGRQHLEESLAIFQQLDPERVRKGEVVTLWGLAGAHRELGQREKAVEVLRTALERSGELDDTRLTRDIQHAVGLLSAELAQQDFELGQLGDALSHADVAVANIQAAFDERRAAEALQARGALNQRVGHLDAALADLTQASEMLAGARERASGDEEADAVRRVQGVTVNAIGAVYKDMGRFEEALEHCQEALAIRREVSDRRGEATTLNDIGVIHTRLGNLEASRRYSEDGLAAAREAGDPGTEAVILQNQGWLYSEIGRPNDAMESLMLAREIHREWKNRRHEGWLLLEMGQVMSSAELGLADERLASYLEALNAFREVGDLIGEGGALAAIGELLAKAGRLDEALEQTEQALAVVRKVGDTLAESRALISLTRIHQALGESKQALICAEQAVELVERLRGEIASQERRASFFATAGELYAAYASLLVGLGEHERALHAAERGRARAFLDLLTEAEAEIREGVDPERGDEERRLLWELAALRQRLVGLRSLSGSEPDSDLISQLEREEQDLELQLDTVEAKIRRQDPRYAALTQPTAWSIEEIREKLLDERTVLLEYVLDDPSSLLFCATEKELEVFTLPAGEEIQAKVRELRTAVLYGLRRYPHGHELYRALIEPAAELIRGRDLLVCADGALHYLPFSLLLTEVPKEDGCETGPAEEGLPRGAEEHRDAGGAEERELVEKVEAEMGSLAAFDYQALPYLLREHAISYAPSATVAGMVREQARSEQRSYDAELAAFADPRGLGGGEEAERSGRADAIPAKLAPIPRTADEVWALASLLSGDSLPEQRPVSFDRGPISLRTAEAATKEEVERLTSGERSFRFFHIATHGLLDPEKPRFSGLVFTPAGGGDPFWRTFEIFNARIPSELVVLSACETGLGRIVTGEGVVGLTRAFLYAGASALCVSLWKVAEASSPQIMRILYQRILDGEPMARALRGAQLELLEDDRRHAHPYWWAPFVVVGEVGAAGA